MLDLIKAIRFDRQMTNGRTGPCLISAETEDGKEVEVVTKFSAGCELKTESLVYEAIAAMLASDLDLPVPEPFLVLIDADFQGIFPPQMHAVSDRIKNSSPIAFGSSKCPSGFSVVLPDRSIPHALVLQATEIFAFDALIYNPDRRPDNPNCLFDGNNYAIIDHELSFITKGIIGWKPSWVEGSLEGWSRRHVFFNQLKGKGGTFERIEGAWKAISNSRLGEYRAALPGEWSDHGTAAIDAVAIIAQTRENIESALAEVRRVLK